MKVNSFQDLEVWREGHKLVVETIGRLLNGLIISTERCQQV